VILDAIRSSGDDIRVGEPEVKGPKIIDAFEVADVLDFFLVETSSSGDTLDEGEVALRFEAGKLPGC
jgi:hypothetical protein